MYYGAAGIGALGCDPLFGCSGLGAAVNEFTHASAAVRARAYLNSLDSWRTQIVGFYRSQVEQTYARVMNAGNLLMVRQAAQALKASLEASTVVSLRRSYNNTLTDASKSLQGTNYWTGYSGLVGCFSGELEEDRNMLQSLARDLEQNMSMAAVPGKAAALKQAFGAIEGQYTECRSEYDDFRRGLTSTANAILAGQDLRTELDRGPGERMYQPSESPVATSYQSAAAASSAAAAAAAARAAAAEGAARAAAAAAAAAEQEAAAPEQQPAQVVKTGKTIELRPFSFKLDPRDPKVVYFQPDADLSKKQALIAEIKYWRKTKRQYLKSIERAERTFEKRLARARKIGQQIPAGYESAQRTAIQNSRAGVYRQFTLRIQRLQEKLRAKKRAADDDVSRAEVSRALEPEPPLEVEVQEAADEVDAEETGADYTLYAVIGGAALLVAGGVYYLSTRK